MEKTIKFYVCPICGNIVELVKNGKGKLVCCGRAMEALEANTKEAAVEKHIPVVEHIGDVLQIKVGSVAHPMTEEHLIEWIVITDGRTVERINLLANEEPVVTVAYKENIEVYAYCNLHGLWKAN